MRNKLLAILGATLLALSTTAYARMCIDCWFCSLPENQESPECDKSWGSGSYVWVPMLNKGFFL